VAVGRQRSAAAAVCIGAVSLVALVAAGGCGGSAFTSAPADASADDGSTGNDGSGNGDATMPPPDAAPPMCILPPNGVGNEADFCAFEARLFSRCGECEQCHQLDANDCVSLGNTLSPSFKAALKACESQLGCGTISSYAGSSCVRAQLQAAGVTPSQEAVKTAYCTACPTNTAECNGFFDLSKDGGPDGFGAFALVVSDAIDQQIVTTCSGTSPKCDGTSYGICMALLFCGNGAAPHGHCPMGLCD
jgi:hypothetical protein